MRATIPNFRQPPRQLQPQGVVAAPPSPPPAPAATIDTGILEMGTSVSVNDEMRRAVTAEVAELEASCSKIASVIQTNEATEMELNKSHHHANADMVALLRSACDAVETVQFNEQILLGLTKTWTAEYDSILQNSHPNELSHQQQQRAWMDDPMMTGTNEQQQQQQLFNVIPASPAHCAWTNSQERIREIAQLRDDCISITAQKETHKRLKEDHDAKEQAIADTVKALQVALANAKYQTAQANEDAEADEKRLRGLKAKLADAEASNNAYRQSVKSSVSASIALRAAFYSKSDRCVVSHPALLFFLCGRETGFAGG